MKGRGEGGAALLVALLVATLPASAYAQPSIDDSRSALVAGLPVAMVMARDCPGGRNAQRLRARYRELERIPEADRDRALAVALASEFIAVAEQCHDGAGRAQLFLDAGNALVLGGERRAAADHFLSVHRFARALRDPAAYDGGDALLSLEAQAMFRYGWALEQLFEFEEALEAYRAVFDEPAFSADASSMAFHWHFDALVGSMALRYYLRQWREFDAVLLRVQTVIRSLDEALAGMTTLERNGARWTGDASAARARRERLAAGLFARATLAAERGQTQDAIRDLERLLVQFDQDPAGNLHRLNARWRLFELHVDSGARSTRATRVALLQAVLDEAARPNENLIGIPARYAARARYRLVDELMADLRAHVRSGRLVTRVRLERAIALADAVTTAYAEAFASSWPPYGVQGIARSADAYALVARALDDAIGAGRARDWQRDARARLACYVTALDRLALGHARHAGLVDPVLETSINRLGALSPEDVSACGDSLPSAAGAFPPSPLDAPHPAPLGLLPQMARLDAPPELAQVPP